MPNGFINYSLILVLGLSLLINGCATAPRVAPAGVPGIYHRVEKGETLWRISKMYNINMEEIVRMNRIPDTASIEIGQLIFIPYRQKNQYSPVALGTDDFTWPVRGKVVTAFGQTYNTMVNKGLNIQYHNNPDVLAAQSGRVSFYGHNFRNFGNTVIIEHSDSFSTVYSGDLQLFVRPGDYVKKGTLIARLNGRKPLHFEIRKGYISQNPYFYLP